MDVSIATADERGEAKPPAPDEVNVAPPIQRRPAGTSRRSNASAAPGIDPALVFRFGKWAALVLVVVFVIWGLVSLFSSATRDRITKSPAAAPVTSSVAPSEPTVTLHALDAVVVSVTTTDGRVLLPETSLARGQSQVVAKPGRIYVRYSQAKNLEVEIDGKRYAMPAGNGPARAEIK